MVAIIKREICTYFNSVIGYVFLAIFFAFAGLNFFAQCLYSNSSSLDYVYRSMFMFTCFCIPLLTMRLISEEKKQKTDQALFTAPISLTSIALGKYISALIVYSLGISITLVYAIIISFFTTPNWISICGSFLGILLLGASLISIGLFLSSITENQVVAAVASLSVGILIIFMDQIASLIKIDIISNIIKELSFNNHYKNFSLGIVDLSDIMFFLSICGIFVFLTVRVFEKRRWS